MTFSSDSSQSNRPTEKNYSSFLDFTRNYKRRSGYFVPFGPTLDVLQDHTGKYNIRRFGGIYAYCRYFIDRMW